MNAIERIYHYSKYLDILIVEDDKELSQSIHAFTSDLFEKVTIAHDAEEAMYQYAKRPYDLIITDINLPGINGLEMAMMIRELDPMQRIVVMSAYQEMEYYEKMFAIGVEGFIPKPFGLYLFIDRLRKIVRETLMIKTANINIKNKNKSPEEVVLEKKLLTLLSEDTLIAIPEVTGTLNVKLGDSL